MHKFLSVLIFALLPVLAMAQQGDKVKCKVVDAKTFKPIKNAVATIEGLNDTTGRNGVFIIYIHHPVKVHLEAEGYEPTDVMVQAGAAKTMQYLKMYTERRRHTIEN